VTRSSEVLRLAADAPVLAFEPHLEPLAWVEPGDTVEFETLDACGGAVASEDDEITLDGVNANRETGSGGNPATGPVGVRGAEPGDTLAVRILSIDLADRGLACAFPGIGPLGRRIKGNRTWFLDLDLEAKVGRRGTLIVPLRPMVGVIGVATGGPTVANDFPGPHGGNLDNRFVRPGSTVYLPVRRPGAMLALGDVHAAMGDGEVTGSGLEAAALVRVQVDVLGGVQSGWPVVATPDAWYTHGAAVTFEDAAAVACEEAARLLEREWGLEAAEAALYVTLAGDLGVCQAAQPSPFPVVARVGVRASSTAPRPFRKEPAWR
jgi:amidase